MMKVLLCLLPFIATIHTQQFATRSVASCRCMPNDPCWPTEDIWDNFNASLAGTLIRNTPIALPCHSPASTSSDVATCKELQNTWFLPQTHIKHPSSVMAPYFTNNSCNPFSTGSMPCTMGNYVEYSVNATDASQFQRTIQFATAYNIRLVIRNTAHDYNGKSTGAGGLALWVHHMKRRELRFYNSTTYSGKAFKFGSGILVSEAYDFAHTYNLTVVGANQGTVGLVGGYTQGGGHGPLASHFGLAADQVLEWEVVLANGKLVTASESSPAYRDLYWALCGGGGGTFGAVVSVTVKAHPFLTLSTASLSFSLPSNASKSATDDFFDVVNVFTENVPAVNDAGAVAIWFITAQQFTLSSLFGPGLKPHVLNEVLQPVVDALQEANIPHSYAVEEHANFVDGFYKQPSVEVSNLNIGGRFIPRRLIESNVTALTSAIRNITAQGALFSGVSFNVSMHAPDSVGANPHWRDAAFDAVIATPFNWTEWQKSAASVDLLTYSLLPLLERLTPDGGAYLNEADFQQPYWKRTLYGEHYARLDEIKRKYDPAHTFYAIGAVGSDTWQQGPGGRLCRES